MPVVAGIQGAITSTRPIRIGSRLLPYPRRAAEGLTTTQWFASRVSVKAERFARLESVPGRMSHVAVRAADHIGAAEGCIRCQA